MEPSKTGDSSKRKREGEGDEKRKKDGGKGEEEISCMGNECAVSTSLLTINTMSDRLTFYFLYILLKDGISF